jgi:hypothetical protein
VVELLDGFTRRAYLGGQEGRRQAARPPGLVRRILHVALGRMCVMPNRVSTCLMSGFVAAAMLGVAAPAQSATKPEAKDVSFKIKAEAKDVSFKIKPEAKDVAFKATEGVSNKKPETTRADQRDDKGKK